MDNTTLVLIFASIGAFFMAFNNGANDVANAFAPAVGSKAITIKQALFIAAFLNLVGAVLLGSHVATTLIDGVLDPSLKAYPSHYVAAMISVLLASGVFVLFSTLTGLPVSSTHAIVGSLAGVGLAMGGVGAVNWSVFGVILMSWLFSPFLAGILAMSTMRLIRRRVLEVREYKVLRQFIFWIPIILALSFLLLTVSVLKRSHFVEELELSNFSVMMYSLIIAASAYLLTRSGIRFWLKGKDCSSEEAEKSFRRLQVGTACYVAFAHGSNDVSNSVSPVIAIFIVLSGGVVGEVPLWILVMGGLGMACGIAVLGHKVMATLGNRITLLTNSKGFCVDMATATTVVAASVLGMPVSSTHAATGSVVGVALEKNRGGLNMSLLGRILLAWLVTVPCAGGITIVIYFLLRAIFVES